MRGKAMGAGSYPAQQAMLRTVLHRPRKIQHHSSGDMLDFLNFAFALELEQVEAYCREYENIRREGQDLYLATALRRAAEIEQNHALNIYRALRQRGKFPTPIHLGGKIMGKVFGEVLSRVRKEYLLKSIILLEHKACKDYIQAYQQTDDPELKQLFLDNLVDEQFHRAWAREKLHSLKNK